MGFGINMFDPDVVKITNASILGVDPSCCSVCRLGDEKIYCPRLLCKWRDKTYEDVKKYYKSKGKN